jgi:uncharacterized protein with gpF-like domain
MNAAEKKAYLRKWHRFQQRHERLYTPRFKAALKEQVQEQIKKGHISSVPIYKVLVELYPKVGVKWAHETGLHRVRKEQKARRPMGFDERIVELMRQYYGIDLLNEAELITAYTRDIIAGILSDAASAGWSFDEIVNRLEASTELGAMRARRIARTETVTAANGAAMVNAKEMGVPFKKIWLAVNDARTRHSHRNVDDVTIGIDDAFNVNGTMMMQPGIRVQPDGLPVPAKEVVNCRCTLAFERVKG